jgi:hypothetical protein
MAKSLEVRGLFGNEYAMENAIEEIKKLKDVQYRILDRRNLQIILSYNDEKTKGLIKNIIKMTHGFVDGDAPLGEIDRERDRLKLKKFRKTEEKEH